MQIAPNLRIFGECFLGRYVIGVSSQGITSIEFNNSIEAVEGILTEKGEIGNKQKVTQEKENWIRMANLWLMNPRLTPKFPIHLAGTPFQLKVWKALIDIPFGTTISYSDFARSVGISNGARAVANACAQNKLAIVVPCHRVTRKDGSLGGYKWGLELKQRLIEWEKQQSKS
ncbi:MAG: methylated-DNA--[protein]-cysteine S-methyltransferase [Firmicutes bacterium]|nr:methylated-DNA--[protein]-cysteine S-methyltransferase [Bacillota bacterium]